MLALLTEETRQLPLRKIIERFVLLNIHPSTESLLCHFTYNYCFTLKMLKSIASELKRNFNPEIALDGGPKNQG